MSTSSSPSLQPSSPSQPVVQFGISEAIPQRVSSSQQQQQQQQQQSASALRNEAPPAVFGHTLTGLQNHHSYNLLLFGGCTQKGVVATSYLYNASKYAWTSRISRGSEPAPRYRHSAAYCQAHRAVYVFGGIGAGRNLFEDLWSYSMDADTWMSISYTGRAPPARCAHHASMTPDGFHMVVSGGFDRDGAALGDMYVLSTSNDTWRSVETGTCFSDRACHGGFLYRGSLYVMGGFGGVTDTNWGDAVTAFEFATKSHELRREPVVGLRGTVEGVQSYVAAAFSRPKSNDGFEVLMLGGGGLGNPARCQDKRNTADMCLRAYRWRAEHDAEADVIFTHKTVRHGTSDTNSSRGAVLARLATEPARPVRWVVEEVLVHDSVGLARGEGMGCAVSNGVQYLFGGRDVRTGALHGTLYVLTTLTPEERLVAMEREAALERKRAAAAEEQRRLAEQEEARRVKREAYLQSVAAVAAAANEHDSDDGDGLDDDDDGMDEPTDTPRQRRRRRRQQNGTGSAGTRGTDTDDEDTDFATLAGTFSDTTNVAVPSIAVPASAAGSVGTPSARGLASTRRSSFSEDEDEARKLRVGVAPAAAGFGGAASRLTAMQQAAMGVEEIDPEKFRQLVESTDPGESVHEAYKRVTSELASLHMDGVFATNRVTLSMLNVCFTQISVQRTGGGTTKRKATSLVSHPRLAAQLKKEEAAALEEKKRTQVLQDIKWVPHRGRRRESLTAAQMALRKAVLQDEADEHHRRQRHYVETDHFSRRRPSSANGPHRQPDSALLGGGLYAASALSQWDRDHAAELATTANERTTGPTRRTPSAASHGRLISGRAQQLASEHIPVGGFFRSGSDVASGVGTGVVVVDGERGPRGLPRPPRIVHQSMLVPRCRPLSQAQTVKEVMEYATLRRGLRPHPASQRHPKLPDFERTGDYLASRPALPSNLNK
eukprot:PhM_4_TR12922/c2_g1_i1/m.2507